MYLCVMKKKSYPVGVWCQHFVLRRKTVTGYLLEFLVWTPGTTR